MNVKYSETATLVHLSDLHFGTEVPAAVLALKRAVKKLAPDLIVVSGDLTQRARRRQFRGVRGFLDSLGVRTLVVPGNHDIPLFNWFSRFTEPFSKYEEFFGAGLNFSVLHRSLAVLGVSSVRPERHQSGAVRRRYRDWIRSELQRLDDEQSTGGDRLNIIVCHHPLLSPGYDEASARTDRGGRLATEWSDMGVDLVLSGHIHRPFLLEGPLHSRAHGRRLWHLGAGTAVSNRLREQIPNSFNLIRSSDDDGRTMLEIEQHDLPEDCDDFVCVGKQQIDVKAGLVCLPEPDPSSPSYRGESVTTQGADGPGDSPWQMVESNWDAFRGRVKEQWGYLTDDHLMQIAGRREQLIANLQRLYGIGRAQAEREVDNWGLRNRLTDTSEPGSESPQTDRKV